MAADEPDRSGNLDQASDASVQSLLDHGYDQLAGFTGWLEQPRGFDAALLRRDADNVEALLDYLANRQRSTAEGASEFAMRWFVFHHYIRSTEADTATQRELLGSLGRFYDYLAAVGGREQPPWLVDVLSEHRLYEARRVEYVALVGCSAAERQQRYQEWYDELVLDLDRRCLWLPDEIDEGTVWGTSMGWREAALRDEANRLWQGERERLLRDGLDTSHVRPRLIQAYHLWLNTAQDRLEGSTPREVIAAEQTEGVTNRSSS